MRHHAERRGEDYDVEVCAGGEPPGFLAGDWTNSGLNAGCIEAAVLSGLQAANAVRGRSLLAGIAGSWYGLGQVDAAPTVPVVGER